MTSTATRSDGQLTRMETCCEDHHWRCGDSAGAWQAQARSEYTAERDYIAYCDGLSGGTEKYATVKQCATRMLGIATQNREALTIWSSDELADRLDSLLTRKDKQPK